MAALATVVAGVALSSCGETTGGGQCGGAPSCGGNVVGGWNITNFCVPSQTEMIGTTCPDVQADASGLNVTGNITFRSDMTYASTVTLSGSLTLGIPSSCLTIQGLTLTCDQLNQALHDQTNATLSTATCAGASDGCSCTLELKEQTTTESGTYATAGSALTTTPTGQAAATASYCVKGSTLTVSSKNMTGMAGMAVTPEELTLSKQ